VATPEPGIGPNGSVKFQGSVQKDSHVAGPFPQIAYVLIVMDYFTKWPEAYAILNQNESTVLKH
jgi:hypothetical protein